MQRVSLDPAWTFLASITHNSTSKANESQLQTCFAAEPWRRGDLDHQHFESNGPNAARLEQKQGKGENYVSVKCFCFCFLFWFTVLRNDADRDLEILKNKTTPREVVYL